jgi:4-hydroxybenzoate polyprenyltransferase
VRPSPADWLALIKFRYHVTFLSVVCGALLFAPDIDGPLAVRLLLLYGCFNILLYGGIYTFNDILDRHSDATHPGKQHRPIASGRVPPSRAAVFGAVLIGAGIAAGSYFFDTAVAGCFAAALAFNACYSLGARNLPYLDLVFVG